MALVGPGLLSGLLAAPFAFVILLIYLRHVRLSLLAAFAPLPGLVLAETLLRLSYAGGYAFGFCLSLFTAAALLHRLLGGGGDWRQVGWAGLGAAATATQFYWAAADQLPVSYLLGWEMPALLLLTGLGSAGALVWGWRLLPFDEAFIARANRAAEARFRVLEFAGQIAMPRWALALSGVALVLAALAWFELPPETDPGLPGFVVMAATIFLLGRDWRAALTAALSAALLWLFHIDTALPFFALPALLMAGVVRARDEEGSEAWRLVLEEWAGALLFAMMGGVLLMALIAEIPFWLTGLWGIATAATALIFFPAMTAALWLLFPRYRSVEEMYRG
jgi:hypothetical protein